MRIVKIITACAIALSMSACASMFPDSHPGHTRSFGSCSQDIYVPTGDTAGPYIGGSVRTTVYTGC